MGAPALELELSNASDLLSQRRSMRLSTLTSLTS